MTSSFIMGMVEGKSSVVRHVKMTLDEAQKAGLGAMKGTVIIEITDPPSPPCWRRSLQAPGAEL